ncbi:iron chelate uptake ABC transporter family permease subunit [Sinorhizobium medicae]|uniref:iron chelate uptake ABC transporter family permease subunit n=1 Tax=Sinorhizobium medicae TaxID=110321 RepID=UPI000373B5BB|nr:iron chelate uptake ABC transporter family permease subunit [Sinorhizobium medicae]
MPDRRLIVLFALAVSAMLAFMTVGLRGNLAFVLELRGLKLLALLQVAISIAMSTILFQTVTANRILTPSIMGLDALYLLGQTAMIFSLGGLGYAALGGGWKFTSEVLLMMLLAMALLWPLLRSRTEVNLFGTAVTLAAALLCWRARHVLDIIGLGREAAIGLGVNWTKAIAALLLLVSVQVAISTALVGPVAFFGLLVSALAERIMPTHRHGLLLPAAALIAIILLVSGQTLLEYALDGASALGIVIEFVGGLVFLFLLFFGSRK